MPHKSFVAAVVREFPRSDKRSGATNLGEGPPLLRPRESHAVLGRR